MPSNPSKTTLHRYAIETLEGLLKSPNQDIQLAALSLYLRLISK